MWNVYDGMRVWTFFGIGMKNDIFQSCDHCGLFQICWHIECSILTASSFRILNCSAGIPSSSLAMFLVILPKAHLTSHSKRPGSKWVTTPSWLSRSLRPFLYTSYVRFCYLLFISSASVRSFQFVLYCAHLCMKCSLGISNFLGEISRLSLSVFFLYLHWSSRKPFLPLLAIVGNSAFRWIDLSFSPLPFTSLLFSAICKASSEIIVSSCISFSWGWFSSAPAVKCHELPSIVLQELCVPHIIP